MATPDLRSDWRQVSEDAYKLHTDVKTAVGDTRDVAADKARHAAGYAAGYARDRAQDAAGYARDRAHDAAGYVHDQTRTTPQHIKDAVGGTADRAGGILDNIKEYLFGGKMPETMQEQVKQGWFGVKSNVGQATDTVKETGEAIKNQVLGTPKPENHWFGFTKKQSIDKPGGDEQYWFNLHRVEPKDPFARLYDDAVAVKDAATRRRRDIEEALSRVPEDARDAAYQVRDSVADWAEKSKEKTKETLEEGWMNWDEAIGSVRKEVEEMAEGIWRSAEDKSHKVTKKIKDVTKVAHKNLSNAYSALENRYAEMDRKMRDEFDTLVTEAGDLKDNYEELRDETIALARHRRDQALSTVRQGWEKGIDGAREKLEQLEKLASKYQPNNENRRAVKRQLREAYDAARGSLDSAVAEARSTLEEAETCVGKTWDAAAGQVRSARESVKEKAHSAWDDARAVIPNPTKVIEGAAHEARDRFGNAYDALRRDVSETVERFKAGPQGIGAIGQDQGRYGAGAPVVPLATLYGAIFAVWFVWLARRVWIARRKSQVWVGDGTLQMARILFGAQTVGESLSREGSPVGVNTHGERKSKSIFFIFCSILVL